MEKIKITTKIEIVNLTVSIEAKGEKSLDRVISLISSIKQFDHNKITVYLAKGNCNNNVLFIRLMQEKLNTSIEEANTMWNDISKKNADVLAINFANYDEAKSFIEVANKLNLYTKL